MRIRVLHETVYAYERPVRGLIQVLRLMPRDVEGQHVRHWRIEPSLDRRLAPREDHFGNLVHVLYVDGPVERFSIRVSGEVETQETHGIVRGAPEPAADAYYLRESSLAGTDAAIAAFADEFGADLGSNALGTLHRLLAAIHERVAFETGPTDAATTAAEAFALGRGVCQDLTHIFIAACRHLGVPARYVSGYFVRADGVVDQEAGHAWAEAKVPDLGWVGFDAANGISTGPAHVRVAVGLDYLGAAPVRGSRQGGGSETLTVRLRVEQLQAQHQTQA